MAGELFDFNCLEIWPQKKGEGVAEDWTQEKYDALNSFAISIDKYAKWINGIWECKMSLSGYYRAGTCKDPEFGPCDPNCTDSCGCCPRAEQTTHTKTIFMFMEHPLRENKCPVSVVPSDGYNVNEGKCEGFNIEPSEYGQIPEEDLNKMRYNVCFGSGGGGASSGNEAIGWHKTWYRRTDVNAGGYCPCPGTTPPAPTLPSQNSEGVIQTISTCGNCECSDGNGGSYKVGNKCIYEAYTVFFSSTASIGMRGGYYNTLTRKVHPLVSIGGQYPSVNWVHEGAIPDDKNTGPYKKHKTSTKMTIDGKSMPIGTAGNSTRFYMGNFVFDTTWTLKDRPL